VQASFLQQFLARFTAGAPPRLAHRAGFWRGEFPELAVLDRIRNHRPDPFLL
jgi:hypothetical protein